MNGSEKERDPNASQPILSYRARIELRDYLAFMRILERLQISLVTRRAVWTLSVLLTALAAVAFWLGVAWWQACFLTVIGGYYLSWPIHHPLYLRRQYRRLQPFFPETDVSAGEDAIRTKSELAEHKFSWDNYELAVDAPQGVLLCNRLRQPAMWFPKRALTEGAKAELLSIAKRNGAKIVRMAD